MMKRTLDLWLPRRGRFFSDVAALAVLCALPVRIVHAPRRGMRRSAIALLALLCAAGGAPVAGNGRPAPADRGPGAPPGVLSLSPAVCTPPPTGLVSWYRGEGNANDSAGTLNGTRQNGGTYVSATVGQGFLFNGVDQSIVVPDSPINTPAQVTVETWVQFNNMLSSGIPGLQFLVFKKNTRSSGFEGYSLVKNRDQGPDRFAFVIHGVNDSEFAPVLGTTNIVVGTWYHVAATYDGAFARLYVNGVQEGAVAATFPLDYEAGVPLSIGSSNQPFEGRMSGTLDEVSLYNRALDATEIAALFAAGGAGKCVPPPPPTFHYRVAGYRVHENSVVATIAVDRSGNNAAAHAITYATSDGTAVAGQDYTAVSATKTLNPGETEFTFDVPILVTPGAEPDETLTLTLSNPTNGASITGATQIPLVITESANGKIAFDSTRNSSTLKIFTADPDGSNVSCLLCTPGDLDSRFGANPVWSPHGTVIAYVGDFGLALMLIDADGFNPRLLNPATPTIGSDPTWSPDATKLAFMRTIGAGHADIFSINANGTGEVNLSHVGNAGHTGNDRNPSWGSTNKIVFQANRNGTNSQIFVMDADGANQTNLSNNAFFEASPDWSPNATEIVYISSRDNANRELYVMPAAGGAPTRRLTTDTRTDESPSWSPDGQRIAYRSFMPVSGIVPASDEIVVIDASDGGNFLRLTSEAGPDSSPDWQPLSTTAPVGSTDLAVTLTDAPDPVFTGNQLTYTMTVVNNGPLTASGVIVSSYVGSSMVFDSVSAGCTQGSFSQQFGLRYNCAIPGTLAPGQSVSRDLVVRPSTGGTFTNQADVAAAEADLNAANNIEDESTVVQVVQSNVSDLELTLTVTPGPYFVGQDLTYTIDVKNKGPHPAGLVGLTDDLQQGLAVVSVTGPTGSACGVNPNPSGGTQIFCNDGGMPADVVHTYTIVARPGQTGVLGNTAQVTVQQSVDPDPSNNGPTTVSITATASADLQAGKTGPSASVLIGGEVIYQVSATNKGPSPATSVTIVDTLPAGMSFVQSKSSPSCTAVGQVVTCTIGTLAKDAAATAQVGGSAPSAAGPITNTAQVSGAEPDPVAANNSASAQTTIRPLTTDLRVTGIVDSPDPVVENGDMAYTISLANAGPERATHVTLASSALPTGMALRQTRDCRIALGVIVCDLADMPSGETAIKRILVSSRNSGSLQQMNFRVAGAEFDPNTSNNALDVNTEVKPRADVAIAIQAPDTVGQGEDFTFILPITNAGPAAAFGVITTATLSTGITLLSTEPNGAGFFCAQTGGQTVRCEFDVVDRGTTLLAKIKVRTRDPGPVSIDAGVELLRSIDPNLANNTASKGTEVKTVSDIQVTLEAPDQIPQGGTASYRAFVRNNGPQRAFNVAAFIGLDESLEIVSLSPSNGSQPPRCQGFTASSASCELGTMDAGTQFAINFTVSAKSSGTFMAMVIGTSGGANDSKPDNNLATAETLTCQQGGGGVPVFRTDTGGLAAAGRPWRYTALAEDPNGQRLTYTLLSGPTGMSIDPATGTVFWTPPAAKVGQALTFVVAVTNGTCNGLVRKEHRIVIAPPTPASGFYDIRIPGSHVTLRTRTLGQGNDPTMRVAADGVLELADGIHSFGEGTVLGGVLALDGRITFDVKLSQGRIDITVDGGSGQLVGIPIAGTIKLWEGGKASFTMNLDGLIQAYKLADGALQRFEAAKLAIGIEKMQFLFDAADVPYGMLLEGKAELPQIPGVGKLVGNITALEISKTNGIRFSGALQLPDFTMGGFGVRDVTLNFKRHPDNRDLDAFEGGGSLVLFGTGVGGFVKIVGGSLDGIGASISDVQPGLPILPPVIFLTGGGMQVEGFRTGQFVLKIFCDISLGGPIANVLKLSKAGITYTAPGTLTGDSNLELLKVQLAKAGLDLVGLPHEKSFKVTASFTFLPNFVFLEVFGSLGGGYNVKSGAFLKGSAGGKVQIPDGDNIVYWFAKLAGLHFPLVIGGAKAAFLFPPGYFSAEVDFPIVHTVAIKVKQAQVFVGQNFNDLKQVKGASAPMRFSESGLEEDPLANIGVTLAGSADRAPLEIDTITLPANTPVLLVRLFGSGGAPRFSLIRPDTTKITPDNAAANGATFLQSPDTQESGMVVNNPAAGTWRVEAEDGSMGPFVLEAVGGNAAPRIDDVQVAPSGGGYRITYNATDADSDAKVALYYDTDAAGFDGTQIESDLAQSTAGTFQWNPNDGTVASGDYFIYAVIDDDVNLPARRYTLGRVRVVDPTAPAAPTNLKVASGPENDLLVSWSPNAEPTIRGYQVQYALDAGPDTPLTKTADAGNATSLRLMGLGNLTAYRVAVRAYTAVEQPDAANPSLTQLLAVMSLPSDSLVGTTRIGLPPLVTVTSPNGSETLRGGNTITVSWTIAGNDVINQRVEYSTDSGATWIVLRTQLEGPVRSFRWDVPVLLDTKTAVVRVTALDQSGNEGVDVSDATFTVLKGSIDPDFEMTAPPAGAIFQFSDSSYTAVESGSLTVTVLRSGDVSAAASVSYATGQGTAVGGVDFTEKSGTVAFAPGELAKTVTIPVIDDKDTESTETFSVTLTGVSAGALLGLPGAATATILDNDGASLNYVLTEGAVGPFFDTYVLVANPNNFEVPMSVSFMRDDGVKIDRGYVLLPHSRLTIHEDEVPGLLPVSGNEPNAASASAAISAVVRSLSGAPLIVERSMYWDATFYGGHTASAVEGPRARWLFAEGSQGYFDTYFLLNNPNATATTATLSFLTESGEVVTRTYVLAPTTRVTVYVGAIGELKNRSFSTVIDATQPISAERAMYFGTPIFNGGHASAGAPQTATTWYHAEGSTGGYFETYLLVGNSNSVPATVTFTYLLNTGRTITKTRVIPPNTRLTVNVEREDPGLADAEFSTVVTSDVPVVSERSMYWPGDAGQWVEGHNSLGLTETATKWGLAEGVVGGPLGFETFVLIGNPNASAADVQVTFLKTDGTTLVKRDFVPGNSRFNVDVRTMAPELIGQSFGAVVESLNSVGIIVERSVYWSSGGQKWAGGSNATAVRIP